MTATPPRARRRLLFAVLTALVCLIAIEGVAAVGLRLLEGRWLSRRAFVHAQGAAAAAGAPLPVAEEGAEAETTPRFVVHPFVGYVRNPDAPRHSFNGRLVGERVNEHGFFGPDPLTKSDDETLTVVLTGGSVALDLFLQAREVLRRRLAALPLAAGRRVEIVCLALGGMKQPQQLLALNYFLALGAKYDVVINLDGFNELVLTVRENLPQGVFPFFPRNWALYGAMAVDLESAAISGRSAAVHSRIHGRAERLATSPVRHSYLALVVWNARQHALERQALELDTQLRKRLGKRKLGRQQRGPAYERADEYRQDSWEGITEDLIDVWINSSLQMERLSRASGIDYYHFLQPNQWVSGTKTLSDYERRYAMSQTSAYGKTALLGYPSLIEAGARLSAAGVRYSDLTPIYRNVNETIYVDNCCHVNRLGSQIMARTIAARIGSTAP